MTWPTLSTASWPILKKAKQMGQAGYERARDHFSWESIADKTVKVYEDVLAEQGKTAE